LSVGLVWPDIDWHSAIFGSIGLAILGHAVNTLPVPKNKWGQWIVGILQFSVGQINRSKNTVNGLDTVTVATTRKENGS
jgi:hypothetical protein